MGVNFSLLFGENSIWLKAAMRTVIVLDTGLSLESSIWALSSK